MNTCSVAVSTVAADGLAPLGTRPSTGPVMIKIEVRIYTRPAFEGLAEVKAEILFILESCNSLSATELLLV